MPERENGLLAAVEATIHRYHMLVPGDTVVVGVSGGPDSVALVHCLASLKPSWSLRLVVAHLNHQLRGATSKEDALFVERLASRLQVPFERDSRDVASCSAEHHFSLEEAARTLRYAFYREVSAKFGANKIALGHQVNDNAESVIMHLLRGTGPRGLSGIPPVRNGEIIRPLIESTRSDILKFLEKEGIEYVEDRSNLDPKFLRNRIRQELLPSLRDNFNPRVVSALNRLTAILRDEEDFWDLQVEDALKNLVLERGTEGLALSASDLKGLHPALSRRVVRQAFLLLKGDLKSLGHHHVQAVIQLVQGHSPSGQIDLPHGVRVLRDRDELRFLLGARREWSGFKYEISSIGSTFIKEIDTYLNISIHRAKDIGNPREYPSTTAFFDLGAAAMPLTVRSFKEGDRFRPLGMSGHQKVKAFFINRKVARSERQRCPLLLTGGRIIWVGGYGIDDSAKVTTKTERVLKAELLSA
jgi:tRNA(Ile)-lysidine synthase